MFVIDEQEDGYCLAFPKVLGQEDMEIEPYMALELFHCCAAPVVATRFGTHMAQILKPIKNN